MSKATWTDVGLIILAILLPPLAVFVKAEEFNKGLLSLSTLYATMKTEYLSA